MSPRTVVVIDDHADARSLVRLQLESTGRWEVCAEASTLREAFNVLGRNRTADVVLVDRALPDGDGVEAVEALRCLAPKAAFVVLSATPEDEHANQAEKVGAAAWIHKDGSLDLPTRLDALALAS